MCFRIAALLPSPLLRDCQSLTCTVYMGHFSRERGWAQGSFRTLPLKSSAGSFLPSQRRFRTLTPIGLMKGANEKTALRSTLTSLRPQLPLLTFCTHPGHCARASESCTCPPPELSLSVKHTLLLRC